ncbi:MAG: hypothetical protein PHD41_00160 [Methanosarcinaceae archaeon]|nr:hypothetical protein [Methanosarcinaceae archaeon]MDD4331711.1 hypothetical protein [Methanosarcinaceae archaeon]
MRRNIAICTFCASILVGSNTGTGTDYGQQQAKCYTEFEFFMRVKTPISKPGFYV